VHIRRARREDVETIVGLLADDVLGRTREAAGSDMGRYYAAFDAMAEDDNNYILVAEYEDEVVGCLQLTLIAGLSLSATKRAQIEGVRVASAWRSRQIGERLIAYACDEAREAGCALMQLTSNATRKDALRFYERLGFEPSHVGFKMKL